MAQFNIAKAKMHLSKLVQKALMGEEVVIAKDNKALVKLVSLVPPRRIRKPGSAKGRIWMAPDLDATPDDLKDYT